MVSTLLIDLSGVLLQDSKFNEELLDFLRGMKSSHDLYVFTALSIGQNPALQSFLEKEFKGVFSVDSVGLGKNDPDSFKLILRLIRKKPGEVLFIDDSEDNIKAAEKAGLNCIYFSSNEDLFKRLRLLDSI